MKTVFALFVLFIFSSVLFAQQNIAVLPFSNLDGEFSHNQWCYELQDSVAKELKALDPEEKFYKIIPVESINEILDELNIDANNPLFDAEKWNVVKSASEYDLVIDKVISGTFRIVAKRYLINSYIYHPASQLTDPDYQAKDIFKKEDNIFEAAPVIAKRLSKAFIKE